MCDQSEVTYSPGDVVWVKLGPVWWPGQVQDYESLPEEITLNLRKKPIAVVKFFQEETFEYVKNLNQIYHYNCRKKEEFIKKGLDMVRSSNVRAVPSNMKMFPNDIVMAEHLTGGDPNILNSEVFLPEQKSNYSDLFGSPSKQLSAKKIKKELKKERNSWSSKKITRAPMKNARQSLPNLPATIPRPITHRRFITKALEGKSDHEVRIRCQLSTSKDEVETTSVEKKYKCHLCNFQSARLNVIVLHNKSHSAEFLEAEKSSRARIKSREREHLSPVLSMFNELTPTTVTSRGRVKSLPKKLLDYTDEPPAKIFKDKVSSKQKEDISEPIKRNSSSEKLLIKSPKRKQATSDKPSVKKPLFGKRKTAKEKAELAAKQKQENEAMKETLLKDWDDDDINQEEVELEKLKQALESTTTSSNMDFDDDDDNEDNNIKEKVTPSTSVSEIVSECSSEEKRDSTIKGSESKSDVKSKVFEFDDSEDNLPVSINFRPKKQEKFTDDKFKKPKPPKALPRHSPKQKMVTKSQPPISEKKEDKETAMFNEALNALLEETVVPDLPEIPKSGLKQSIAVTNNSDQTSDISSSTDLLQSHDQSIKPDEQVCNDLVNIRQESKTVNEDLKMECTSSETEEVNASKSNNSDLEQYKTVADQKNSEKISASNPRVEMGLESSSGVVPNLSDNEKCGTSINKGLGEVFEDIAATEISSSCDVDKSVDEKAKVEFSSEEMVVTGDCSIKTENLNKLKLEISEKMNLEETGENTSTKFDSSIQNEVSKSAEITSTFSASETKQDSTTFKDDSVSKTIDQDYILDPQKIKKGCKRLEHNLPSDSGFENKNMCDDKLETKLLKTILVPKKDEQTNIVDHEKVEKITNESEQLVFKELIVQEASNENATNVQLTLPHKSDSLDSTGQKGLTVSTQQPQAVPKLELIDSSNIIQDQSQNLQDMELDINSMPVIIGGEDLLQPEFSKDKSVSIQPNYSESIIISPKEGTSSSKSRTGLMQLEEATTSKQNIPSVIAFPGKQGKNKGARSQKGTSKTIKLSATALKNLGLQQKGGNQQVLILKTATGQDKQDKGAIQTSKGPLNMFQHGNKILIVNNPQMSGQNKIKLNPQQQQLLSGGKLTPGTRVFTSKVVATTTVQSSVTPSKVSTSKSPSKPSQKLVISKGSLLSNNSKSIVVNNSPTKLVGTVQGTQGITTNKGQTLITHGIVNKKGIILPNSSLSATSSAKTTTIITSQSLATSKNMILTPIASKGGNILSANQKLRIVSSKAPLSGTRLVVQNSQGKLSLDPQQKGQQIKLVSGLKGQASGSTILIQTSQGILAKTKSATQPITTAVNQPLGKAMITAVPNQTKIQASPMRKPRIGQNPQGVQSQILQQIVHEPQIFQPSTSSKKVAVQKVKQSPNILQKVQRKTTTRVPRFSGNRLITSSVTPSEPILINTTSSFPVINQSTIVQDQVTTSSDGLVYVTIDEAGNYRPLDNKSLISFGESPSEAPRTIFIPSSNQSQDVGNIFLAIDEAGNIVNISQPTSSLPADNVMPGQDILAKALANTQVLQQETIIPDIDVSAALSASMESIIPTNSSFNDQVQYPAPSLSHSVLETSLTLNQPIMTPLEVPSAVTSNIGQISSITSNYIAPNILSDKDKLSRPSMPLLTEESLANQSGSNQVFLLDNTNNVIPSTSSSQISFQLTMGESNVLMSSGSEESMLTPTYQVVSGNLLTSQLVDPEENEKTDNIGQEENVTYRIIPQTDTILKIDSSDEHQTVLQEKVQTNQIVTTENDDFFKSTEVPQIVDYTSCDPLHSESCSKGEHAKVNDMKDSESSDYFENLNKLQNLEPEELKDEKVEDPCKRGLGEENTVTSSSDLKDGANRVIIDKR